MKKVTKKQYEAAVKKLNKAVDMSVLEEHFERDHGGCDQDTCSMTVAFNNGYTLHAIECWLSCGATSEDTNELAEKIPADALATCSRHAKTPRYLCLPSVKKLRSGKFSTSYTNTDLEA